MDHIDYNAYTCTGCGACVQACPTGAIHFDEDEKGFFYPNIHEDHCVHCGKCMSVCQLIQPVSTNNILGVYAVQNNDRDVLQKSSSGGLFSAAAEFILSAGGTVYGCAFDEHCTAVYKRAFQRQDIEGMRGSKYVWSDASVCYKDVHRDLNSGKKVLFTGLPCQVSGLHLFLGKEYPNLYTLDCLCGGPPSPLVFKRYVESIASLDERKMLDFRFRDKTKRGTGYCISYIKRNKRQYSLPEFNAYLYLFSNKLVQRDACFHCRYRGVHRAADITMGDFWGVKEFFPHWDEKAGVSFAIVNSSKGVELLDFIKNICTIEETELQNISKHNIIRQDDSIKQIPIPPLRDEIFKAIHSHGWRYVVVRYTINKKRIKRIVSGLFH